MVAGGRVLVINDRAGAARRLAYWLKRHSYDYVLVESVEEAQALQAREVFDAVVRASEFRFDQATLEPPKAQCVPGRMSRGPSNPR